MAKWYGPIGYGISTEVKPGVWKETIKEIPYSGDILENSRRIQTTDQVNDNIQISNKISIIANPFAKENFHAMRYVHFMGAKWKITNVEVKPPRLILTIGGLYNGK